MAIRGHTCVNGAGSAGCECCYIIFAIDIFISFHIYFLLLPYLLLSRSYISHFVYVSHTSCNFLGMAAMNNGAHDNNGHIVGVIHEKFVVDGSDWYEGAHSVFAQEKNE